MTYLFKTIFGVGIIHCHNTVGCKKVCITDTMEKEERAIFRDVYFLEALRDFLVNISPLTDLLVFLGMFLEDCLERLVGISEVDPGVDILVGKFQTGALRDLRYKQHIQFSHHRNTKGVVSNCYMSILPFGTASAPVF